MPVSLMGWLERVDFPDWQIKGVKAKVDTGAKTSSLDVDHIEITKDNRVRFNVVLKKTPFVKKIPLSAKISRIAKVKSSPIHNEHRIFVKTLIKIGEVEQEIELNLINRSNMVYRMLIGRSAIPDHFHIDPAHKYILSKKKRQKESADRRSK